MPGLGVRRNLGGGVTLEGFDAFDGFGSQLGGGARDGRFSGTFDLRHTPVERGDQFLQLTHGSPARGVFRVVVWGPLRHSYHRRLEGDMRRAGLHTSPQRMQRQ